LIRIVLRLVTRTSSFMYSGRRLTCNGRIAASSSTTRFYRSPLLSRFTP
jgi:hypothetical protein